MLVALPLANYRVPFIESLALIGGALGAQTLRFEWARWILWTAVVSATVAAITVPMTWALRFGACALLVGPIVTYAGSQLRDM